MLFHQQINVLKKLGTGGQLQGLGAKNGEQFHLDRQLRLRSPNFPFASFFYLLVSFFFAFSPTSQQIQESPKEFILATNQNHHRDVTNSNKICPCQVPTTTLVVIVIKEGRMRKRIRRKYKEKKGRGEINDEGNRKNFSLCKIPLTLVLTTTNPSITHQLSVFPLPLSLTPKSNPPRSSLFYLKCP